MLQVSGTVTFIRDGIITIASLPSVFIEELVYFGTFGVDTKRTTNYVSGIVKNIDTDGTAKAMLFHGTEADLFIGMKVYRSRNSVTVHAGHHVVGQLLSPTGYVINFNEWCRNNSIVLSVINHNILPIEAESPGIVDRSPVRTPLHTGVNSVDSFIPIGHGQRELIIGDKNSGKTTLAVTFILHQRFHNNETFGRWRQVERYLPDFRHSSFVPCIYVSIGQRRSEIAKIAKTLRENNALNYTTIVFTAADENPGLTYVAPLVGTTLAEWFRDNGYRSVVVYDDISNHAVAYRQISLLLRRPPGREAYPGDVFYQHSKLLERAAQLHKIRGGGSLTSFPIVETKANDISAFIPTNIISITDGQIYLSAEVALQGVRPAVHIGLSVSRVGAAAQYPAYKKVSNAFKVDYSLYQNYRGVEKLGGGSDPLALSYITRGKKILKYLNQELYVTDHIYKQILCMYNLTQGNVDKVQESFASLYFSLVLSKYCAKRYSNGENYVYIAKPQMMFAAFVIYGFGMFETQLKELSSAYERFFRKNMQEKVDEIGGTPVFRRAFK